MQNEDKVLLMGYGEIDPALALVALYNKAQCFGMGAFCFVPGDMTIEEAQLLCASMQPKLRYFDYVKGRVLKIGLRAGEALDFRLYDRDNGVGAGLSAIMEVLTAPAAPHGSTRATGA